MVWNDQNQKKRIGGKPPALTAEESKRAHWLWARTLVLFEGGKAGREWIDCAGEARGEWNAGAATETSGTDDTGE